MSFLPPTYNLKSIFKFKKPSPPSPVEFPKYDFRLFGMEDAELKRTFAPKSLQWRLTKLGETIVDLATWWKPKPPTTKP